MVGGVPSDEAIRGSVCRWSVYTVSEREFPTSLPWSYGFVHGPGLVFAEAEPTEKCDGFKHAVCPGSQ